MSSRCRSGRLAGLALLGALAVAGCEREQRQFRSWPPAASPGTAVRESGLAPGPATPDVPVDYEYEHNAWAVSEGKRLFSQFNCSGCHSQGGGGIGPPLMDSEWIYGSQPENIFQTIVEGRPNGMPAFGGKVGTDEVWKLVAYVRSMSGLLRKDVAPGRSDDMQVRPQEQSTPRAHPVSSGVPPSAERP